jgi:cell division transport system permease protein
MARSAALPLDEDGSTRLLPWLVGFMVFLASLATGAGFAIDTALSRWDDGLRGSLTVQLPQPILGGKLAPASIEKAVQLLHGTAGIRTVQALDQHQEAQLLQPWLGESVEAGQLPLPILIDVQRDDSAALDLSGLAGQLGQIVPGAIVEAHGAWLDRLFRVAALVEIGAGLIVALIGSAATLTVIFTTRTGLMIHASVVDLLHVIGAPDSYVASQFQWHAFRLGLRGGIIGLALALVAFAVLGFSARQGGTAVADLAPGFSLPIIAWGLIGLLPLIMGLVGLLTARWTVLRILARMP